MSDFGWLMLVILAYCIGDVVLQLNGIGIP